MCTGVIHRLKTNRPAHYIPYVETGKIFSVILNGVVEFLEAVALIVQQALWNHDFSQIDARRGFWRI